MMERKITKEQSEKIENLRQQAVMNLRDMYVEVMNIHQPGGIDAEVCEFIDSWAIDTVQLALDAARRWSQQERDGAMMQVTSPIPGTYSVHFPDQRPVEGVAVWEYLGGIWRCEQCSPRNMAKSMVCKHIALAKKYKEGRDDTGQA